VTNREVPFNMRVYRRANLPSAKQLKTHSEVPVPHESATPVPKECPHPNSGTIPGF
jgi:hypothetical protein